MSTGSPTSRSQQNKREHHYQKDKSSVRLPTTSSSKTSPYNQSFKENLDTKQAAILDTIQKNTNNTRVVRRAKRPSVATPEPPPIPPIPYHLRPFLRALGSGLTPDLKEILDMTENLDETMNALQRLVPQWLHQNSYVGQRKASFAGLAITSDGSRNTGKSQPRLVLSPILQQPSGECSTTDLHP
ncbi:hypothetical protein C8R42DRAFT_714523 [Lentinula raphanica]|nr:hypothetical protein C8R42DRAFT_714523 [Lentinula raphanica]